MCMMVDGTELSAITSKWLMLQQERLFSAIDMVIAALAQGVSALYFATDMSKRFQSQTLVFRLKPQLMLC